MPDESESGRDSDAGREPRDPADDDVDGRDGEPGDGAEEIVDDADPLSDAEPEESSDVTGSGDPSADSSIADADSSAEGTDSSTERAGGRNEDTNADEDAEADESGAEGDEDTNVAEGDEDTDADEDGEGDERDEDSEDGEQTEADDSDEIIGGGLTREEAENLPKADSFEDIPLEYRPEYGPRPRTLPERESTDEDPDGAEAEPDHGDVAADEEGGDAADEDDVAEHEDESVDDEGADADDDDAEGDSDDTEEIGLFDRPDVLESDEDAEEAGEDEDAEEAEEDEEDEEAEEDQDTEEADDAPTPDTDEETATPEAKTDGHGHPDSSKERQEPTYPDPDEDIGGISTPPDDEEMPLADHIEEMVMRMAVVILVGSAATAIALLWSSQAITIIWENVFPGPAAEVPPAHVYHPLELWLTRIKVAALAGIMVAIPMLVYEGYLFMRPGLYPHERKYYLAAVPTSVVLAGVGMLFSFVVVLPLLFEYFTFYSEGSADIAYALGETFNLIITLTGFLAIVFQIPLFVILAVLMGVTTRTWLTEKRLYFWAAFAGLSFMFTMDPTLMAPIIVAIIMVLLFEGTLLILKWAGKE